jgi:uncharacterized protein
MGCAASNPAGISRPQQLIETLQMHYLQGESGYFALRSSSEFSATFDGAQRPIHSSIYYLLTADKPVNYLHWLASEDIHILVEGGPLTYYIFHESGTVEKVRLGTVVTYGEVPVVTVPARSYKAIVLDKNASHGLMVNVLTPAWSADRVKIGADKTFIETFQNKAEWATPDFLRSLMPSNQ